MQPAESTDRLHERTNDGDASPQIFALEASRELGEAISREVGLDLLEHEERVFPDGEHKVRPLISVRERDVYVIHSLFADDQQTVNDKLCRLLFFVGALKGAAAARVTVVAPYLCYARKDRKTKKRDPVTIQYVARMFEAVGTDRLVTCDVHNLAAFQNALRIQTEHLIGWHLLIPPLNSAVNSDNLVVVSPDVGGLKRARAFRDVFEQTRGRSISLAVMEKKRSEGTVSGEELFGSVENKTAIIVDDLISTGTTMRRTIDACQKNGAREVLAAATHGILLEGGNEFLAHSGLRQLFVTNTVRPLGADRALLQDKTTVVDTSPLFAEVIQRLHTGGSVTELLPL